MASYRAPLSKVAALQQMRYSNPAAQDLQCMLRNPKLTDVDMYAMRLNVGEWYQAIAALSSHPSVARIDLRGIALSKSQWQDVLDLARSSKGIVEIEVDDPHLRDALQPVLQGNTRSADATRQQQGSTAGNLRHKAVHLAGEFALLENLELKERSDITRESNGIVSRAASAFFHERAHIVAWRINAEAVSMFLTQMQNLIRYSSVTRYNEMYEAFLEPFSDWRVRQEIVGRQAVADTEAKYRKLVRKRFFASFEHASYLFRMRRRMESEQAEKLEQRMLRDRGFTETLETKQRGIISAAIEQTKKRARELEDAINFRVAEDKRKRQQRVSELETKRQFRLDKLASDSQRLREIHSNDREKLARGENGVRQRTIVEETQVFNVIADMYRLLWALTVSADKCGKAIRERNLVLHQQVAINSVYEKDAVRFHFADQNSANPVVPYHFAVTISLTPAWETSAAQSISASHSALKELRRLQTMVQPRYASLCETLDNLGVRMGLVFNHRETLHSIAHLERFSLQQSAGSVDIASLRKRKLVIWGGKISARCDAGTKNHLSYTFLFDPSLTCVSLSSTMLSAPNFASCSLATNGTVTIADLEQVVKSCRVSVQLNPGGVLPISTELLMDLTLHFRNLDDVCGVMMTSLAPYEVTHRVACRIVIAKPFVSVPRTLLSWRNGESDLGIFDGLQMQPPPAALSDGKLKEQSDNLSINGATVLIEIGQGKHHTDTLLLSSSADLEVVQPEVSPPRRNEKHSRTLIVDGFEVAYVEEGQIETRKGLEDRFGLEFVFSCPVIKMKLLKPATVRRIEQLLRQITFFNWCAQPPEGKREVSLSLTTDSAKCEIRQTVFVEKPVAAVKFSLSRPSVEFIALSTGHVLDAHAPFVKPTGIFVAPNAALLRPDGAQYFSGGFIKIYCGGYMLGDALHVTSGNGISLRAPREPTPLPLAEDSSEFLDEEQRDDVETPPHTEEDELEKKLGKTTHSIWFHEEEIGEMITEMPLFLLEGTERVSLLSMPKKPLRKEKEKSDPAASMFDLTFNSALLEARTLNGPQQLTVTISPTGAASLEALNALLSRIQFSNSSVVPKMGTRKISIEMVLMSHNVRTNRSQRDTIRDFVAVNFIAPIIRIDSFRLAVKYLHGSGWKSLPSLILTQSTRSMNFDGGFLEFEVVEGYVPSLDFVWIRGDALNIVGVQMDAIPLLEPQRLKGYEEAEILGDRPAKVACIYSRCKVCLRGDGTEIATMTFDVNTGKLVVSFNSAPPGHPPLITNELLSVFARGLVYRHSVLVENASAKGLHVALRDGQLRSSHVFFKVFVRTDDDPSEIVLSSPVVQYRHGLIFEHGSFADFCVAPLGDSSVADPDTEFYDGGELTAQFKAGAAPGDEMYLLSYEAQKAMYAAQDLPPVRLLRLDGENVILEETSQSVAVIRQAPSRESPGATNLLISFAQMDEERANKSLAPIALVTYFLNCIAFRTAPGRACKVGGRHVRLTISDGSNPKVGEAVVTVDVVPPFIAIQNRVKELEAFFFIGGAPVIVFSKVVSNAASPIWSSGHVEFRIVDPTPDESLGFVLSSGAVFFDLKPIQNAETRRGSVQAETPCVTPRGGTSDWLRPPAMLVETHGAVMGKLYIGAFLIRLKLMPNSLFERKHMEAFLRCVTYETKNVAAAHNKVDRLVIACASDTARPGGFSTVEVRVRLGVKTK